MASERREYTPMVAYDLPLRPTLLVRVVLPRDFSAEEAERLCGMIRSLAFGPPVDSEIPESPEGNPS